MQLKRSIIFSIFQEKVFPLYYMDKVCKVQVIHREFSVVRVIVQLKQSIISSIWMIKSLALHFVYMYMYVYVRTFNLLLITTFNFSCMGRMYTNSAPQKLNIKLFTEINPTTICTAQLAETWPARADD